MRGSLLAYYRNPNYLTWLRAEASLIDTDGCSAVSGVRVECCYEHDLHYFYGRDARDAYRYHRSSPNPVGDIGVWRQAKPISFEETNVRFRKCLQARSTAGRYSPLSWWRWLGVTLFSKHVW